VTSALLDEHRAPIFAEVPPEENLTTPRIPLNTFAIPLGLAGLGEVWTVLGSEHDAPALVGDVIMLIAAAAWVAVMAAYLSYLITTAAPTGKAFSADFLDPIGSPFGSLAVIVPVALASDGLYPHAAASGRVITDFFIALTVLVGSWFTGQWIYGPLDLDRFHPGYFLPTVAGGLIAAEGAALVGPRRLAEVLLGFGVMSWVVVGSLILGRLFFRPLLPPTMAIEVAPAAVSTAAWFAIHGRSIDTVTAFLAGYGVLMVLAQLRLLPAYLRLKFMPTFWAFTFSWAAVVGSAILWLQSTQPAGYRSWQYVLAAALTAFIGAIAIRTLIAHSRHQYLPGPPAAAPGAAGPAGTARPASAATP
jgi:tellurite resistance protein